MKTTIISRKEFIEMFLYEYYFGYSLLIKVFRLIGGPLLFYLGYNLYNDAPDRLGVGYAGFMVVFSIYYTTKPLWWILFRWKQYEKKELQIETTSDKLIIQQGESKSIMAYSEFNKIVKRRNYFSIQIQTGLKIYLPLKSLSQESIDLLSLNQK